MTTQAAKRRAVGEIEWVMDKLETHAVMTAGRPVTVATLRLLPSSEQCRQLADRLGAALVELGHARDERGTRSQQRVGRHAEKKRRAKCKPTGRVYRTVDALVAAECSPEVQAEYARLRSESRGTPTDPAERAPKGGVQ